MPTAKSPTDARLLSLLTHVLRHRSHAGPYMSMECDELVAMINELIEHRSKGASPPVDWTGLRGIHARAAVPPAPSIVEAGLRVNLERRVVALEIEQEITATRLEILHELLLTKENKPPRPYYF